METHNISRNFEEENPTACIHHSSCIFVVNKSRCFLLRGDSLRSAIVRINKLEYIPEVFPDSPFSIGEEPRPFCTNP
jgi:hypothetical protein